MLLEPETRENTSFGRISTHPGTALLSIRCHAIGDLPLGVERISEGDALHDARQHIREAIDLYLAPIEDEPVAEGAVVEELAV